ncbi:MAG: tRNA uridine-5-carboxymethylaminomethyl(34) synthesis enzyme MnmG [Candidatus Tantalella remota]|nr:tRNA uridine-5-carboxymethylaminomethyl(34) synthesis enzyme MnmG [Candidatus Tantalella remota]
MANKYSVIIVGGGHAGCEAALASARMGLSTLLITMKKEAIGYTSCNPSIGGVGKGQLVKEVDALGGEMGKAADAACIQYRMLNSSKGYAARSSRMQIDRKVYNAYMNDKILAQEGLDVVEDEVEEVIVAAGKCEGVRVASGEEFLSSNVVLTTGTFMNGTIHIGLKHSPGGRIGEEPSGKLSGNLAGLGFEIGTLKTGTPARIDGRTIDFSLTEEQPGDAAVIPFSFSSLAVPLEQKPCYLTRTNAETHEIIRGALDRSPLYSGKIQSTGVRYCPSIEDKVVRFPERESHVVFLEPEGLDSDEYYPNGISTSLPVDVQESLIHSIKGLENTKINTPAYGIEYDYVEPTQLDAMLQTKKVEGLFIAGQINGTTGYEEAAALGLMAGINAARKAKGEEPVVLERSQAYIGVLIDDLVTKGTKEPYRMFTSRVEYRIVIREDNADTRLSNIAYDLGLSGEDAVAKVKEKEKNVAREIKRLNSTEIKADSALLKEKGIEIDGRISLGKLLKRPDVSYDDVSGDREGEELSYYEKVQLEVDIKYAGYIERELARIKKFSDLEKIRVSEDMDYSGIEGLSNEIKEKLTSVRPVTLGQASRVSGVTPAAISILMVKISAMRRR